MKVQDLAPIAIIFVVAGIALGIGAEVLSSIKTDLKEPTTYTNNSINFAANNTYYNLAHFDIISVSSIKNTTDTIGSGNYTYTGSQVKLIRDALVHTGTYNVSYSYYAWTYAVTATENSTIGVAKIAKWMPTIGLVVAAAIVIGVVVTSFSKREI